MSQKQPYTPGEFQWSFCCLNIGCVDCDYFPDAFGYFTVGNSMALSSWIGKPGKYLKSRRKTTIRNLEVCFPEWSPEKYSNKQNKFL